jgi:hypothetical protein
MTEKKKDGVSASPYMTLLAVQVLWDELFDASAPQCEQGDLNYTVRRSRAKT